MSPDEKQNLIELAQSLIRIKSFSGQEGEIIHFIENKMKSLAYDEIMIDSMGNLVGRIGVGEKSILIDSHVDVVAVNDADEWNTPPFSGAIIDGRLYGRGAVDMKSALAASIYAGVLAKKLGYASGKTIYISCSTLEEECDGVNLKHLFTDLNLRPDYVVICEPSNNQIAIGHRGKAQVTIKTRGISAHSSAPEKGVNAVYEMAEIIQRVEKTNAEVMQKEGSKRSIALSKISSTSVSINAIPSECEIYLDRRIAPGETEAAIKQEMDRLIEGKNATWEIGTLHRTSWTGMDVEYEPFHMAWKIDSYHDLTRACIAAYLENFGIDPVKFDFWDFSTNAVTPVNMGIPTIGFGPGDGKLAHMRNENCDVDQIIAACGFYTRLIQKI